MQIYIWVFSYNVFVRPDDNKSQMKAISHTLYLDISWLYLLPYLSGTKSMINIQDCTRDYIVSLFLKSSEVEFDLDK